MSNVIKAAAITYTQEIRTIDSNEREGGFTRLLVEKRAQVKEDAAGGDAVDFEPGIRGLFTDRDAESGDAGAQEDTPSMDEEAVRQLEEQARAMIDEAREEVSRMLTEAQILLSEIFPYIC